MNNRNRRNDYLSFIREQNKGKTRYTESNNKKKSLSSKGLKLAAIIIISAYAGSIIKTEIEKRNDSIRATRESEYQKRAALTKEYERTYRTQQERATEAPPTIYKAPIRIEPAQTAQEPTPNYSLMHQQEVNDNHRRVLEIQEREKQCRFWRHNSMGYDLATITENVRHYCR